MGPGRTTSDVEGTYFEACSCTFGVCDFALSWWIKRGYAGELDLTDRKANASPIAGGVRHRALRDVGRRGATGWP